MKIMKQFSIICIVLLIGATTVMAISPDAALNKERPNNLALSPIPATIDRVIHNVSNINTTVDNYGLVGGYYYYDLPSGEWPRNSCHHYIAEMKYWMGAISSSGDTLIANTDEDFQAIPMPNNGSDEYRIYLSTDTTRYHNYDLTDTVGLGLESPSYGWRVWNPVSTSWTYNRVYNSLASSFNDAGPTSRQDSYYRFNDAALGSSLLGLELSQQVFQWNYCYNEDFMYVILDVTNTSTEDYAEFAFGLYVDIDVGGFNSQGGNGRLYDAVVYDTANSWAFVYDVQGYDPGWDAETGVMGTKILETPNNVGMTAFRTDDWGFLPEDDGGKFNKIDSVTFDTPLPPTDQYYIQAVRGVNLTAGSTVRLVYAIVAGNDSADFVDNANRAQELYDANYVGPEPPKTPVLTARPADGKIYLSWDNSAESSTDPLSGENDFAGYKLYRSDNQGITWGKVNHDSDNDCLNVEYHTLATYRVLDPTDPIPHLYIDDSVYNGVEYWYCLASFDNGDTAIGIDPLQSGFGVAGQTSNVVAVMPRTNPAGYYEAEATVVHEYFGNAQASDSTVKPIIYDLDELSGEEFEVTFEDSPVRSYWHLINRTTGDTLLADQTVFNNGVDGAEIIDGLTVLVTNPDHTPTGYFQTSFAGVDTTLSILDNPVPLLPIWTGNTAHAFAPSQYRPNYELRYTLDSTPAASMWEGFNATTYPRTMVPFEAWNMTTNQRVWLGLDEQAIDGLWEPGTPLFIMDIPYDSINDPIPAAWPYYLGWRFTIDSVGYNPSIGDVLTIEGSGSHSPDDRFVFKVGGISTAAASGELENIRVVPDPYLASYSSMVETNGNEAVIEFQGIPDECTIRIYTLSGELVRTLDHNAPDGFARWNLLTNNQQQVASGVYLYHVDSPYGERLGRFSIIK